jgi:hypothetical protein
LFLLLKQSGQLTHRRQICLVQFETLLFNSAENFQCFILIFILLLSSIDAIKLKLGSIITQAVSPRLLISEARFRSQAILREICGGQMETEPGSYPSNYAFFISIIAQVLLINISFIYNQLFMIVCLVRKFVSNNILHPSKSELLCEILVINLIWDS